jgi:hypothetical protein
MVPKWANLLFALVLKEENHNQMNKEILIEQQE